MKLEELYDYKNRMMKDILENEEIRKLLLNTSEDVSIEDALDLRYKQVFPYEFMPDTSEHGSTYICFDVDVTRSLNKPYIELELFIWIFTHKSLMRTDGGLRPERIASEICRSIDGSMYYGLGHLEFYSSRRFAPMTDYLGKKLTFKTSDIGTAHPRSKIPNNRKTWD